MLESTGHTHDAIAEQGGYRSVESFRVAFRTVVGLSPSAYRERFGREAKALLRDGRLNEKPANTGLYWRVENSAGA
nr:MULTISPECIES: helix-turn-helix domain-containing protein [unclassified Pseudomonas]